MQLVMSARYQINTLLVFMVLLTSMLIITNKVMATNLCLEANICYEKLIKDGYITLNNKVSVEYVEACTAFEKCVFDTKQQAFSTVAPVSSANQSNNLSQLSSFLSALIYTCSVIRNQFLLEESSSSSKFCPKMQRVARFETEKNCKRYTLMCLMTNEYTYENTSDYNPKYCGLFLHCVPDCDVDHLREMMVFPRTELTMKYCPYNDFCLVSSSKPTPNRCSSCSCDYDCGMTRSCCFDGLDTYHITEDTAIACQELRLNLGNTSLYVVSTCPDGSQCNASVVAPASSLQTYRIYLNSDCVRCNCLQNYTVWDSGMSCPDSSILTDVLHTNSKCSEVIVPPDEHLDMIKRLACPDSLYNTCRMLPHLKDDCRRVWAPLFSTLRPGKVYRNPHCAICDGNISPPSSTRPPVRTGPDNDQNSQFLVILNHQVLDQNTRTRKKTTEKCIMHQGICRPVLCPEISIRVDRTCQYIYKQWRHVTMSVQLRLRPFVHNHALTQSSLKMLEEDPNKWLYPKCSFILSKQNIRVKIYIRYFDSDNSIIVRQIQVLIVYKGIDIVPGEFISTLKTCLQNNWEVKLNETTYSYAVQLVGTPSINDKKEMRGLAIDDDSDTADEPEQFVDLTETLLDTITAEDKVDLFVTKLLLCEQIDLASFEVKQDGDHIVLLHNEKRLRKGEYSTITIEAEYAFFKVCIEDFLHGVKRSSAHAHLFSATLTVVISGVVAIFVNVVGFI